MGADFFKEILIYLMLEESESIFAPICSFTGPNQHAGEIYGLAYFSCKIPPEVSFWIKQWHR